MQTLTVGWGGRGVPTPKHSPPPSQGKGPLLISSFGMEILSLHQRLLKYRDDNAINRKDTRSMGGGGVEPVVWGGGRGAETDRERGKETCLCTGDPYYVLYTALLIS
jgi:hypothetical protein